MAVGTCAMETNLLFTIPNQKTKQIRQKLPPLHAMLPKQHKINVRLNAMITRARKSLNAGTMRYVVERQVLIDRESAGLIRVVTHW